MDYGKSAIETIRRRSSCRSFDSRKINEDALKTMEAYAEELSAAAVSGARFFLTGRDADTGKGEKLGTYGVIAGARRFMVGVANKQRMDEAEFGYLFEKWVLAATALDLGTCWLGGTFKREDFAKNAALLDSEFIPIVSPVGIKRERRSVIDRVMRAGAGSDKRKPPEELFFDLTPDKPLAAGDYGAYATALEAVRIGPSASNKQPWRVVRLPEGFAFYLCRTKGYGVAAYDIQKNDIGIAMCHFELAAAEGGLNGHWDKTPPETLAGGWEFVAFWHAQE